jgi:hypothetical protein
MRRESANWCHRNRTIVVALKRLSTCLIYGYVILRLIKLIIENMVTILVTPTNVQLHILYILSVT